MFLKSLTLKGFKSFADATTLELMPGVTVVVGPNGSGKSNVVDAVAWVLGAQGPRTVRSARMDDVIFAGTTSRSALGRAEVALTIDNSSRVLDIGFTEVTLTRTLFRSGDSEYAINGVPCRLLDVQELLSDSGVGRTQHVIVGQGHLDAVLNARPEERRQVIEEAAGILKHRKRREKAVRRLEATEANLVRLSDLVREVRRQLRPLERQAEAARRHGALAEELAGLRLHLAGREVARLRVVAREAAEERARRAVALATAVEAAGALEQEIAQAEEALDSLVRADSAPTFDDPLVRGESVRGRAGGLAAVLAERRRTVEGGLRALTEAAEPGSLETDAARLRAELAGVEAELEALAPRALALAEAEVELEAARAALQADGEAPAPTRAAELRGELGALRGSAGRADEEMERLDARLATLRARVERLATEVDAQRDALAAADQEEKVIADVAAQALQARAAAELQRADAEAALRHAEGEWRAWAARADALGSPPRGGGARAGGGSDVLQGLDGVLGPLVEWMEIDPGWEGAVMAAAGEAIEAVVVEGTDAARRALVALAESGASGSVLPVLPVLPAGAGAAAAGERADPLAGEGVGEAVRGHVRSSRPDVAAALDWLLADAVAVAGGWDDLVAAAIAHPQLVVVSRRGERIARGVWAIGAGGRRAAAEEARQQADEAEGTVRRAAEHLAVADAALAGARTADADAARARDDNARRGVAAEAAVRRLEAERSDANDECQALASQLERLRARSAHERARIEELERVLPDLEAAEVASEERLAERRGARHRLQERAAALASERVEVEVRAAGLEERRASLSLRLDDLDQRQRAQAAAVERAARERGGLERRAVTVARLGAFVAGRVAVLDSELASLRELRRRRAEQTREAAARLDALRRRRAGAESELAEARERLRRAELDEAQSTVRAEEAVASLRRDFGCEPEVAERAPCPDVAPGTTAAQRTAHLERELRQLGPINPLALEEHAALSERVEFLDAQLDDVKSARRELGKVIRAVDAEIVEVFAAAYADVAANFEVLFGRLFPGGQGRLRLTDPDDLLATGIEVDARPSGKNVRQLSLLSGGERAMAALAFLFAVFRSRPSPFYLLDEVEAALDDVNLQRFLDLLDEFRRDSQLIVVTHQKRTMEAADCLYGVTMQSGGSSRVVSERISAPA